MPVARPLRYNRVVDAVAISRPPNGIKWIESGPIDRDLRGQFVKGWRGGPGRPSSEIENEYLNLWHTESKDRWPVLVRTILDKAAAGEDWALGECFRRILGPNWSIVGAAGGQRQGDNGDGSRDSVTIERETIRLLELVRERVAVLQPDATPAIDNGG